MVIGYITSIGLNMSNNKIWEKDVWDCVHKVEYTLPFDDKCYTINGDVTQNISHSWEVLPQRFVYDFAIVDDKGEGCFGIKRIYAVTIVMKKIYLLQQTVWLFHRKTKFPKSHNG